MDRLRRSLIVGVPLLAATLTGARADALGSLATTAAGKGPVLWYESSAPEQIAQVITAFNRAYPAIRVQYVRNTGGASIAARIIQESSAGAQTASFITADAQQFLPLEGRGLVLSRDWAELGIDPKLVGSKTAVGIAAAFSVIIWNKTKVADAEAPASWDDLLSDRWRGRIGQWSRGAMLATLGQAYGGDRMRDFTRRLVALQPMIYPSTYQLSQQIASGEVDVGMGLYHTIQPALAGGAPVGMRIVSPVPINTLWGGVVTKGANPEGGQVLLAWLASRDGAIAYETATSRGNPLVQGTQTAALVAGKELVESPLSQIEAYDRLDQELTKLLGAAGQR